MTPVSVVNRSVGLMPGSVMFRNLSSHLAPSMLAASYCSVGTP